MTSALLARTAAEHVASNTLALAMRDGFPVSQGHARLIRRRLGATWPDATPRAGGLAPALVGS